MKKQFKSIFAVLLVVVCVQFSYGQQDAQYTQYMYNTLSINPAYAGSRDVLSFVGLYRSQWVGLDGAPTTYTASLHSPVGNKVGLGLNLVRDEIFISNETYIDLTFSYTLDVTDRSKFAFGLKAGAHLLDIDPARSNTGASNGGDVSAGTQLNIDNKFSPQFGLGGYYYTDDYYIGFSAPNILETEHFDESTTNSLSVARERVNFYLIGGYVFDINESLDLKPAVLFKAVNGAPLQADLSLNALIKEKLTLGVAYRWSAALSAMAGFQISDQLMIGFGYDRESTELNQFNDGSYELMLRYEFFKDRHRMVSPRFF